MRVIESTCEYLKKWPHHPIESMCSFIPSPCHNSCASNSSVLRWFFELRVVESTCEYFEEWPHHPIESLRSFIPSPCPSSCASNSSVLRWFFELRVIQFTCECFGKLLLLWCSSQKCSNQGGAVRTAVFFVCPCLRGVLGEQGPPSVLLRHGGGQVGAELREYQFLDCFRRETTAFSNYSKIYEYVPGMSRARHSEEAPRSLRMPLWKHDLLTWHLRGLTEASEHAKKSLWKHAIGKPAFPGKNGGLAGSGSVGSGSVPPETPTGTHQCTR